MGIKSVAAIALAIGSVAAICAGPADANNNDKYLNELAMQMYMQNQAQAYNPYMYNNAAVPYGYAGQTPWSAGAMPYAYNGGNYNRPYYNRAYVNRNYYHHSNWWR